jgi:hypothetical protein
MVQRRLIDGVTVVNGGIVVVQWRSEGSSMLVQRCAGWLGDLKKKNLNSKNGIQNLKIKTKLFFFFFLSNQKIFSVCQNKWNLNYIMQII